MRGQENGRLCCNLPSFLLEPTSQGERMRTGLGMARILQSTIRGSDDFFSVLDFSFLNVID